MNKPKNIYRIALGTLLALSVLAGLLLSPKVPVLAQKATAIPTKMSNTTIGISPANPVVNPGDSFDVNVTIQSDTQSRAAQCQITFDPKQVEVTGVSEGTFYKQWASANGASTIMVPPKPAIDNQKGTIALTGISLIGSPGNGPTGNGTLLIIHAKANPSANGTANFGLTNLEIDDTGDASGRVQQLGGVKVQNGTVAIGSGAAAPNQPTAQAVAQPTAADSNSNPAVEPTIARISTSSSTGGDIPWIIILPAFGVVIIGAVVFTTTRKRK
ncbi:MAG: cohesin domain-containing protein [Anaerolineaceae bacterium]|nr:cohesin domain-containing protein [Anaerolineaceae bacterium]